MPSNERFNEKKITLLDGGMGQELRARQTSPQDHPLWSTKVMMDEPDLVRAVHEDFLRAGADIILTNSYSATRGRLEPLGLGDQLGPLNALAGRLANDARETVAAQTGRTDVLIAGSLPPLDGSYRPDLVRPHEAIREEYAEQVALLSPFVDLFICETMSLAREARAAAEAALMSGKPVMVAWTVDDGDGARLRSGEAIADAWAALEGLEIAAVLANCSFPEAVTSALPALLATGRPAGGYANGFVSIPDQGVRGDVSMLERRDDLTPDAYAAHAQQWLGAGATIIGGCCEVGPAHIAALRSLIDGR